MPNIILCGFMGSGKSSVGRELAKVLHMDFIDMDQWIEQKENLTVSEIFSQKGELFFRELEYQASVQLSALQNLVLATGGGTLLASRNAEVLSRTGTIFLLDVPLEIVQERLKNDETRPLLQHPDRDSVMRQLYEERLPSYRKIADHTVNAAQPINMIVKEIAACLHQKP